MDRTPVNGLVVSGLAQIALGALAGFPYAIATYQPQLLAVLGVRAPHRIRQLHLDLIMMGALVTATGAALPRLPRVVAVPLAVGCWTNALAFAPPAVRPSIEGTPLFRAVVAASFVTTSAGWVAAATIAASRWRAGDRAAARAFSPTAYSSRRWGWRRGC
ncbi:hypothetical protein K1T35_35075 [Pseudonocardia sp. DSM 110487]|uniref:hypothetical protein n=1 Tax=Pseudonocardia sp. DSM 110487 TaxID=2865833 RepID=UPI001C69C9E8|nr:hypothetical protein [Pseudonocardia sp. DSM 110487]QYN33665.1 hypothetical protein K1T35_35075 [Pseudonocardia sp. DSM 110487]